MSHLHLARNSAVHPVRSVRRNRVPKATARRGRRLRRAWKHAGSGLSLRAWALERGNDLDATGELCAAWLRGKGVQL